jgi:hypothetical protein
MRLVQLERRIDPWVRPAFDAVLRDPTARLTTWLINLQRKNEGLKIAEERIQPDEDALTQSIIDTFKAQMRGLWKPGGFERGGNTKTHGIVRAEFIVHDGLPPEFRHGIFAEPRTYRSWVRFSGPGPYVTPDIDDVGFMSISIKLMGVPRREADERRATHAGYVRRVPAHVRDAGHARECAPAGLQPEERVDLPLRELPQSAPARLDHAGAVHQDAEQSARGAVLQLRALSPGQGTGDAVFGVAEVEQEDADSESAAAAAR